MVVAFEGMDGVGKSTTAKQVALRTNFIHEPQKMVSIMDIEEHEFSKLVKTIRKSANKKLGFMFYTVRCMIDVDSKQDTIVERSMISTYYFEHNNVSEEEFEYTMTLNVIPDLVFLLYASVEERYKRIYQRNENDTDLKSKEALTDGYPIMLEFAQKYKIPYIGIDTEKYTPEEIIDICSDIVIKIKNMNPLEKEGYIQKMNEEFGFDKKYKPIERILI